MCPGFSHVLCRRRRSYRRSRRPPRRLTAQTGHHAWLSTKPERRELRTCWRTCRHRLGPLPSSFLPDFLPGDQPRSASMMQTPMYPLPTHPLPLLPADAESASAVSRRATLRERNAPRAYQAHAAQHRPTDHESHRRRLWRELPPQHGAAPPPDQRPSPPPTRHHRLLDAPMPIGGARPIGEAAENSRGPSTANPA